MSEHRKQLTITVLEAKGLKKPAADKPLSPYCLVTCNSVHFRTNTQHNATKPEWKQRFSFNEKDLHTADDAEAKLTVTVWSYDKYSTDLLLGQAIVPLSSLTPNATVKQWYSLHTSEDEKSHGKIYLELTLNTDSGAVKRKKGVDILKRKLSLIPKDKEVDSKKDDATSDSADVGPPSKSKKRDSEEPSSGTDGGDSHPKSASDLGANDTDTDVETKSDKKLPDSLELKSKLQTVMEEEEREMEELARAPVSPRSPRPRPLLDPYIKEAIKEKTVEVIDDVHSSNLPTEAAKGSAENSSEDKLSAQEGKNSSTKGFAEKPTTVEDSAPQSSQPQPASESATPPTVETPPKAKKSSAEKKPHPRSKSPSTDSIDVVTSASSMPALSRTAPASQSADNVLANAGSPGSSSAREGISRKPSIFQMVKGLLTRGKHPKDHSKTGSPADSPLASPAADRKPSDSTPASARSELDSSNQEAPEPAAPASPTKVVSPKASASPKRRKKHGRVHTGESTDSNPDPDSKPSTPLNINKAMEHVRVSSGARERKSVTLAEEPKVVIFEASPEEPGSPTPSESSPSPPLSRLKSGGEPTNPAPVPAPAEPKAPVAAPAVSTVAAAPQPAVAKRSPVQPTGPPTTLEEVHQFVQNMLKLRSIENALEFTGGFNQFSLSSEPSRSFVREGALKLLDEKGLSGQPNTYIDVYGFLFSDLLLICKQLGGEARFVTLFRLKLERTFLVDPDPESTQLQIVDAGASIKKVTFATTEAKKSWARAIETLLSSLVLAYHPQEKQFIYNLLASKESKAQEPLATPAALLSANLPSLAPHHMSNGDTISIPKAELTALRTEMMSLKKDYDDSLDEANSHREKLSKDIEAKDKTISELKATIEEMKTELKVVRKKDPLPAVNAQMETQLTREIGLREASEAKAMEFMNKFLEVSSALSKKQQHESDLMARIQTLESEVGRLRRASQPMPPSALKKFAAAASSPAQVQTEAQTQQQQQQAPAHFIDFEKERQAFEQMFSRGKSELMEIIKSQAKPAPAPRPPVKAHKFKDDVFSDPDPVHLSSSTPSTPKRRKSTPAKPSRKRSGSTSSEDKGGVSGNEAAMRLELEQLRKFNRELTSKVKILETGNRLSQTDTAAPEAGESAAVVPPSTDDTAPTAPTDTTSKPENKPVLAVSNSDRLSTSSISSSTSSSSQAQGDALPASPPIYTGTPTGSPSLSQSASALNASGSVGSTKTKKLKAVRFNADLSENEGTSRGNWRNVAEKLGLKKKKDSPTSPQERTPWRKQPASTDGSTTTVVRKNKADLRSETSYWSDDFDSDYHINAGGSLSANEAGPVAEFRRAFGTADNSDYATDEEDPHDKTINN